MVHFLGDSTFVEQVAGKKAQHLHLLAKAGFRVPPGFVITHDEDLDGISGEVLSAQVERIGGFPVAVRSSGVLEDLAGASFAGQYETFLSVAELAALRRSVDACRRSATSERVRTYLRKAGLDEAQAKVSVLVQRMVDAAVAGVGFSLDPMSGREEHGLVECCLGLGEKLVSGHVTPSRYVIDLQTGSAVEEAAGSEGAALSPAQQKALGAALLDIQAHFGAPQDVEWAIDQAGELWILQSRPITKVEWRTDTDELSNADFKDGGVSARVSAPLMLSLYQNAFDVTMQRYVTDIELVRRGEPELTWFRAFYGRGYWSAGTVKRVLSKVPGFDEQAFDRDLGLQKDYGPKGPMRTPVTLSTVVAAIPIALAQERHYRLQLEIVRRFAAGFEGELRGHLRKIDAFAETPDEAFFADLERVLFDFHARTERTYFTTIYDNVNAQSDFKKLMAALDEATGEATAVTVLMGGLTNISHLEMQRGIVALHRVASESGLDSARFAEALRRFLEVNGFHANAELDITEPRWAEAPERVTQLIEGILRSGIKPADPDEAARTQRSQFEAERARTEARIQRSLLHRLRFERAFRKHLARVRTYLSAREEMREYSSKCYAVVRRYVVEAGRRLHRRKSLPSERAIFMLNLQEIRRLLRGELGPEVFELVAFRERMYEGYRLFQPPNELGRSIRAVAEQSHVHEVDGAKVLRGLGCSPGRVEGVARVVSSLAEVHLLQPGDILVTRFTDPGWTPVLGLVSGVVTEVGGLLSHAAVIGREYGIPAVLNLPGATRVLRSGQRIRVDGSSGIVEIVSARGSRT